MQRFLRLSAVALLTAWVGHTAADYTFKPALDFVNPASMALLDIAYCEGRLIAVGERGLIAYSDDDGGRWTQAQVPVSQLLTAVACADGGFAFAAGHGGVLLGSTDRGVTWTLQFDGNEANRQWLSRKRQKREQLKEVLAGAEDADREDLEYDIEGLGFDIEDAEAALEAGPVDPFLDIWFRDKQFGYAVGAYGMLYRTENGGASWELEADHIENPDRYHYYSIVADEAGNLFLSGEAGLLYRSTDQGYHWERLDPRYDGSLFGLVNTLDGAVLGFGLRGNVLLSEDTGDTWRPVTIQDDPQQGLHGGVRLVDGTVVLVGSGGVVLHSRDNGRTFAPSLVEGAATLSAVTGRAPDALRIVGMEGLMAYEVPADD